jgi:ectoine hydroxylase-related dioxygenase (phytanoyl-CoA dioxygenase family)
MLVDYLKKKEDYNSRGFFICKNFFTKEYVNILINEITHSKDNIKYFDKKNRLRRIEKLYDKGEFLIDANNKIIHLIKLIFDKEFLIFKDKFNAKPPGGDGFFAHYDGIFKFLDDKDNLRNGWYEYGDFFINALVALDDCDKENGTIELANFHEGNFDELIKNTKNDGTPALKKDVENELSFEMIDLNIGDVVFFSNTCPHRSKKNNSNRDRRILYYTYSLAKNGSKYEKYFFDKLKSKNPIKALNEK